MNFLCFDGGNNALNTYLYYKYFSKEKYIFKFNRLKSSQNKFEDIEQEDYKIIIILNLEMFDKYI